MEARRFWGAKTILKEGIAMNDYLVTMRIKNGRVHTAMRKSGIGSVNELSKLAGVSPVYIGKILNFKVSPFIKPGIWRDPVLKICEVLAYSPAELFPNHLQFEVPTNKIEAMMDQEQMNQLCCATPQLAINELHETFDEIFDNLTDRESEIIKKRFYEERTIDSIAKEIGVTGNRIRAIEQKALRKMRDPRYIKQLEAFLTP